MLCLEPCGFTAKKWVKRGFCFFFFVCFVIIIIFFFHHPEVEGKLLSPSLAWLVNNIGVSNASGGTASICGPPAHGSAAGRQTAALPTQNIFSRSPSWAPFPPDEHQHHLEMPHSFPLLAAGFSSLPEQGSMSVPMGSFSLMAFPSS